MRIQVTQEDLERGVRYCVWECPLAYAFKRAFNSKFAFVGATVCLDNGIRIDLQDVGLEKRTAFDRGEQLELFEIPISAEAVYRSNLRRSLKKADH